MFTQGTRVQLAKFPMVHGTVIQGAESGPSLNVQFDGGVSAGFPADAAAEVLAAVVFPRKSLILDPQGNRRMVIEEVGDLRFVSAPVSSEQDAVNGNKIEQMSTFEWLRQNGYLPFPKDAVQAPTPSIPPGMQPGVMEPNRVTPQNVQNYMPTHNSLPQEQQVAPVWPKQQDQYFYLTTSGTIAWARWKNEEVDRVRQSAFGVYKTPEEAEAALARLKNAVKQS